MPTDSTLEMTRAGSPVPAAAAESFLERADRILATGPRPTDFVPVPAEVQQWVDSEVQRIETANQFTILPEAVQRMLADQTLAHYYTGLDVITLRTAEGVVALAVGPDEVDQFLDRTDRTPAPGVCLEYP